MSTYKSGVISNDDWNKRLDNANPHIAVNQKSNSCEGCYNLSTEQFGKNISFSCCKASQVSISRSGGSAYNTVSFEYREVTDPTVKPPWCPL